MSSSSKIVEDVLATVYLCREGDVYHVAWSDEPAYTTHAHLVQPYGELRIIHDDADIVVVDKPAFMPTENTATIKRSARSLAEAHCGCQRLHVPHRLDWETSGLLVLCKTASSMRSLASQFAARSVRKVYIADVHNVPPFPSGTAILPMATDAQRLPRQCIDFGSAGKRATTQWEVMQSLPASSAEDLSAATRRMECGSSTPRACRLRLMPETGRRHQLRVHCLALGCPIAGDALYTPPDREEATGLRTGRLHLHAAQLTFIHPTTGVHVSVASDPPFSLQSFLYQGQSCSTGSQRLASLLISSSGSKCVRALVGQATWLHSLMSRQNRKRVLLVSFALASCICSLCVSSRGHTFLISDRRVVSHQ